MSTSDQHRNRLLAVLTFLLLVAALRASYPVTMPLAFSAVVVAAMWPLKPWLDRMLPSWASYVAVVLILFFLLVGFGGAVYFSAAQVVRALVENWSELEAAYNGIAEWANRYGLPVGGAVSRRQVADVVQTVAYRAYTLIFYVGFIGILVILGLPEVPAFRRKAQAGLQPDARSELLDAAQAIAEKVRRYLAVTVGTSLLTGVSCASFSFAVGLELGLVWGVLNFLLNFIPVVGNIVGIIPPTLYALVQYGGWTMPLAVFAGFAVIQLTISNFVYPLLQGHSLSLSPVAIVVALAFWSWIWGIGGALIAVPLTAALVIICEHFSSTRWIARVLAKGE